MSNTKLQYGIRVKCKRSLTPTQIAVLENTFRPKVYGKWACRSVPHNRKYVPQMEYTSSKRYFAKYATLEEAREDIISTVERVALIK